jgi:hypothetical protein
MLTEGGFEYIQMLAESCHREEGFENGRVLTDSCHRREENLNMFKCPQNPRKRT